MKEAIDRAIYFTTVSGETNRQIVQLFNYESNVEFAEQLLSLSDNVKVRSAFDFNDESLHLREIFETVSDHYENFLLDKVCSILIVGRKDQTVCFSDVSQKNQDVAVIKIDSVLYEFLKVKERLAKEREEKAKREEQEKTWTLGGIVCSFLIFGALSCSLYKSKGFSDLLKQI